MLYPRYKTQNYPTLDSSWKSQIFEAYHPKKNFRVARKNWSSFCCLFMFFDSLEQLKRVEEKN